MSIETARLRLDPISPELARRIVTGDRRPDDNWHPDYPFEDELAPLRVLAETTDPDPVFTLYVVRLKPDDLAVGGFGFFGPPDERGRIEFGYGLVAAVRGRGLATEAVIAALDYAAAHGARRAVADTDPGNLASQRVLIKAGLIETGRTDSSVAFERELTIS